MLNTAETVTLDRIRRCLGRRVPATMKGFMRDSCDTRAAREGNEIISEKRDVKNNELCSTFSIVGKLCIDEF